LEEKQALTGINTPPETLIEIEQIKGKISDLRIDLEADDFRYGIKIDSPEEGAKLGTPVRVSGRYTKRPPDRSLRLFAVSTDDGCYWPQKIAHFGPNKTWHSEVSFRTSVLIP
jgi:hypothetical protein